MYTPSEFTLAQNNGSAYLAAISELGGMKAAIYLNELRGFDTTLLQEKAQIIESFINAL